MAYTTIDNPELFHQNKLYSGTGSAQSITFDGSEDMQPDWVWIKRRAPGNANSGIMDSVRGATKLISSQVDDVEQTLTTELTSFDSDGFSVGNGSNGYVNQNGSKTYVAWCWKAGGTAPTQTYTVKVVSDSGNKYRFDDFGTSAVTLDLQEGGTYTFDQSDSSNSGHPLRFSTTSNGTHGGGSEYTTGVTTTGTPGSAGAKTVITVAASAPTLYYYCTQHSGMGGQANTNSTFGSSNFSGSIQSTVSSGITQGMSIVSYTGTGSNATVGHGLGVAPKFIIIKNRDESQNWIIGNDSLTSWEYILQFNTSAQTSSTNKFNSTAPTSSVFSVGTGVATNGSSDNMIAYCFADKKGFSKFGSYTGNGNADGTFVYTGFKPAWVLVKNTSGSGDNWIIVDNKRLGYNPDNRLLFPNASNAEYTDNNLDLLSNGFKARVSYDPNGSGNTMIYMAFAESPFVNSNGVPINAR